MSIDYFQIAVNGARDAAKRIVPETHFLLAEYQNGADRLSACNAWKRESEHSDTPTCETCARYVAENSREVSADELFGTLDRSTLVEPSYGKNADRHYNSYTERRR